jgi:hypothetical protein
LLGADFDISNVEIASWADVEGVAMFFWPQVIR